MNLIFTRVGLTLVINKKVGIVKCVVSSEMNCDFIRVYLCTSIFCAQNVRVQHQVTINVEDVVIYLNM